MVLIDATRAPCVTTAHSAQLHCCRQFEWDGVGQHVHSLAVISRKMLEATKHISVSDCRAARWGEDVSAAANTNCVSCCTRATWPMATTMKCDILVPGVTRCSSVAPCVLSSKSQRARLPNSQFLFFAPEAEVNLKASSKPFGSSR